MNSSFTDHCFPGVSPIFLKENQKWNEKSSEKSDAKEKTF